MSRPNTVNKSIVRLEKKAAKETDETGVWEYWDSVGFKRQPFTYAIAHW